MNKNERNQLVEKYQNKNVLLKIINDLSNNYISYNKIYMNNLLNFVSFYENLSLLLESLPSKLIFPKLENITLFNNSPSVNIINDFYIFHQKYLNNLQKLSANIKQKIIPKLMGHIDNLDVENSNPLKDFSSRKIIIYFFGNFMFYEILALNYKKDI